jgi:hypothetical protein
MPIRCQNRRPSPQLAHTADYHNPAGQVIVAEQFAMGREESGYAMLHSEADFQEEQCHRRRDDAAIAFH